MPLVQALLEALVEGQTDGRLQGLILIFIMLWPGPMLNSDIIKSYQIMFLQIRTDFAWSFQVLSQFPFGSCELSRTLSGFVAGIHD